MKTEKPNELERAPVERIALLQSKDESPDMLAMRAFASALALVPRHHAIAAAAWMWRKATDPKTMTKDDLISNSQLTGRDHNED